MKGFFQGCDEIEAIDFTNFFMHDIFDMSHFFDSCTSLKNINYFDPYDAVDMSYLFYNCISLTTINYKHPIFKLKTNYSLPKIRNKNNVKYKNLYESSTSFYNTNHKDKDKDKLLDSTAEFFIRNYDNYLSKINRRSKFYNSKLMSETELNTLLYKLKNYYSDVIKKF